MLLSERVEVVIKVCEKITNFAGRPYYEVSLVSDDGQTLHIYEGQLKEIPGAELEVGARYKATFRPFVNNRWIEFKISGLEREAEAED